MSRNAQLQYGFEQRGDETIGTETTLSPDAVRRIKARSTWNHDTGYSFTEEFQGGREEIFRASIDPLYVCGSSQIIVDEDPHDRSATMAVAYAHRTKELARQNLAQVETFKTTWTLQKITEQVPLWRHPAYAPLRSAIVGPPDFVATGRQSNFPYLQYLTDLLESYEQAYNARLRKHMTIRLTGVPDPSAVGVFGQQDLSKTFYDATRASGKTFLPNPDYEVTQPVTAPGGANPATIEVDVGPPLLVYPKDFETGEESAVLTDLTDDYIANWLENRKTALLERNILTNVSIIPPNGRYSGLANIGNRITNTPSIAAIVTADLNQLINTRDRTPAGCLDISANKRALVDDLNREYGRYVWFIEPQTTKEIRNGSVEVRRNFVQRHFFEINFTVNQPWFHPFAPEGFAVPNPLAEFPTHGNLRQQYRKTPIDNSP